MSLCEALQVLDETTSYRHHERRFRIAVAEETPAPVCSKGTQT